MLNLLIRGRRSQSPVKSTFVQIIGSDVETRLMARSNFVSPSTDTNSRSTECIQCSNRTVTIDPTMLQCILQQQDGACTSRRHSWIHETGSRLCRWTSRHVRWARLVAFEMNKGSSFAPHVTGPTFWRFVAGKGFAHGRSRRFIFLTAPLQ